MRKAQNLMMPKNKKGPPSLADRLSQMSVEDDEDVPHLEKPESRRKPNETSEEKRARKQALREFKKDRLGERKQKRNMYAMETAKLAPRSSNIVKIDG
ncbi:hypothetical protein Ciccas_008473 [Cichlidogyrus casuarinus]|uniref:Uncharacterized protein n=1 Tax=Cichlidogyrus casuarinus TaxID=1844966 RepID=A0ABD2Q0C4_9PLAT